MEHSQFMVVQPARCGNPAVWESPVALFGSRKKEEPSALIQRGDYSGAASVLRKRLKSTPEDLRMRNQLGDALAGARDLPGALKAYQQVAEGHAASGFTAKALAIWKKMSRLAPDDEELLERIAAMNRPAGAGPATIPSTPAVADPAEPVASESDAPETQGEAATPADPQPEIGSVPLVPTSPLFPDFTPEEFTEVARLIEHRRFDADQRIVSEGEPGESMFVIAEGTVRVTIRQEDGELELAKLGPGDFFGEVALITKGERTASIEAVEPCELLELSGNDLDQITARHPRVREVMEEFNQKRAELTVEAIVEARIGGGI